MKKRPERTERQEKELTDLLYVYVKRGDSKHTKKGKLYK